MTEQAVRSPGRVAFDVCVPGDKSIAHRALLLSSLADGESRLTGLSDGLDVQATMACLTALGVELQRTGTEIRVAGRGIGGFTPPRERLDCQNSGTTLRLLTGILAAATFPSVLTGDASLRSRPMDRVIEPLTAMGAVIQSQDGRAPLRVEGQPLQGVRHVLRTPTAQVKSALLLAGLQASGTTCVTEPIATRDHTERLLAAMGAVLDRDGLRVCVAGGMPLRPLTLSIPGDFSSAAFWLAAAALRPGWTATVRGAGVNPTRTAFLQMLAAMGAEVASRPNAQPSIEPVGDITVTGGTLRAIELGPAEVASAIDEMPLVLVLATQAAGTTRISGAQELRVKESDRIAAMCAGLQRLGARARETPDGAVIEGPTTLQGATVDSREDHRVAMALAIAGLVASGPVHIRGAERAAVSYPAFFQVLAEARDER